MLQLFQLVSHWLERLGSWLWRTHGPAPVAATLGHNDCYEINAITVALAKAELLDSVESPDSLETLIEAGEIGLVLPAALVATVRNRSSSATQPIYVREVTIDVTDYMPQQHALTGLGGLVVRAVQSGGRGSEAHFTVSFRTRRRAQYDLVRTAVSDGYDGPRRIRIDPGRFGEFVFDLRPELSGRYRVSVVFRITDGRRSWRVRAKNRLMVYRVEENPSADPLPLVLETHQFGAISRIDYDSFLRTLASKTTMLGESNQLASDRPVAVTARMSAQAL